MASVCPYSFPFPPLMFCQRGIFDSELPSPLFPASVYRRQDAILVLSGRASSPRFTYAPPAWSSLKSFLLHNPTHHWCFADLNILDNGIIVAEAIRGGYAVAISDGSFCERPGSEGADDVRRIVNCSSVLGEKKAQSLYQSELMGLFCTILFVSNLCEYYNMV